jgi:hypothetical protein
MTPRREDPAEAIVRLLVDELKAIVRGLPDELQRSLPQELQDDIRTLGEEDSTGKAGEK